MSSFLHANATDRTKHYKLAFQTTDKNARLSYQPLFETGAGTRSRKEEETYTELEIELRKWKLIKTPYFPNENIHSSLCKTISVRI